MAILIDGERNNSNNNPKGPNAGELRKHNGFHTEIMSRICSYDNQKDLRIVAWQLRVAF